MRKTSTQTEATSGLPTIGRKRRLTACKWHTSAPVDVESLRPSGRRPQLHGVPSSLHGPAAPRRTARCPVGHKRQSCVEATSRQAARGRGRETRPRRRQRACLAPRSSSRPSKMRSAEEPRRKREVSGRLGAGGRAKFGPHTPGMNPPRLGRRRLRQRDRRSDAWLQTVLGGPA